MNSPAQVTSTARLGSIARHGRKAALSFACALLLGPLSGSLGAATPQTQLPELLSSHSITVRGTSFLRDGRPWTPHGVVSVAFNQAPTVRDQQNGLFAEAYRHLNAAELKAMHAWGADSVRFQVSQPALDPQDKLYASGFLNEIEKAVVEAHAAGLSVILSVQDEKGSGEPNPPTPLPNAATGRVWQQLAPAFKTDHATMFEILNEPEPLPNPPDWAAWQKSMDSMIRIIRQTGATNVLIADGLNFAERLSDAPRLNDPLEQLAFADHPYPHSAEDQTDAGWDRKFGRFAANAAAPVLITEWSDENEPNNVFAYCDSSTPEATLAFLRYIDSRRVGLMAMAWDLPNQPKVPRDGRLMRDFTGTPTTLSGGAACHDAQFGPGAVVQHWYRTGQVPNKLE